MKLRPGRLLFLLLLLAAVAGGGWWIWNRYFVTVPPSVITAQVSRGSVEQTVLASGTIKPERLVSVGSQVSGRIVSLDVVLGQEVKAGDLIAQIDSTTQENALRTAEAALKSTRAQRMEREATLRLAEQTAARQADMLSRRAVSQADADTAAADVEVARAQIEALDAQIIESEIAVETATANLGYTRITAPIDGTVLAVVSQAGQTLNANQSAPTVVILGDLRTMTVRAEISEADILRVEPGQRVYFTVLGDPGRRYQAVLDSIEPAPEAITSDSAVSSSSTSSSTTSTSAIYFNGIFRVPNDDGRLKTYMTAEVHIVLGQAENALTIPSAALGAARRDGTRTVSVQAADGSVTPRAVTVGLDDRVTAEVLAGLEEGERVVTGRSLTGAGPTTASVPSGPRARGPLGF